MRIVNRQAREAYEAELVRLDERHHAALAELETRKPVPIELEQLAVDAEPIMHGKAAVMPGMFYGYDEQGGTLVINPAEIGPGEFWEEAG
ncbi:MAG TPA: hypothetical protein VH541_05555 [Gaiellaceae bacterium]|jgi:hypothetical protein